MSTTLHRSVHARPRRLRRVCISMSLLLVGFFVFIGVALKHSTAGTAFHTSDQVAMIGLGVLIAAGVMLLARPTVDADEERIRIRNIFASYNLRWQVVEAVRFPYGASWASLDLHDDETVAVLAIQAVDRMRAVEAVEGLRELLEISRRPTPPPADGSGSDA